MITKSEFRKEHMIKSNTIAKLENQLTTLTKDYNEKSSVIQNKLRNEYVKAFESTWSGVVTDTLKALNDTKEYDTDSHGEIRRWAYVRSALDQIPTEAREAFEAHVNDLECAYIDWEVGTVYTLECGNLIINDDGDVLDTDSGKWVIQNHEYDDDTQRNNLIEQYMEKSGYYPNVFKQDRHGNVFWVNTKAA